MFLQKHSLCAADSVWALRSRSLKSFLFTQVLPKGSSILCSVQSIMSMSLGVVGGSVKDSKTFDSDIDTCGVSQAAAASPIDNGSLTPLVLQPIKDESNNADESNLDASKEQPLRKSAEEKTGLANEMSTKDSSASVWWTNELDRLENAEKCCIGCKNL